MVAAALPPPALGLTLSGDAPCSSGPADWQASAPASPPSMSPTAAALLPAAQLCDAGFGMSSGAAPDIWEAEAALDGMCGWGEGGESCHSGLPLSVPLPAVTEGGRPSAVDCSWGSCRCPDIQLRAPFDTTSFAAIQSRNTVDNDAVAAETLCTICKLHLCSPICSPAEDGSLSPPVSPADSGSNSAQGGAAAGVHEVLQSIPFLGDAAIVSRFYMLYL